MAQVAKALTLLRDMPDMTPRAAGHLIDTAEKMAAVGSAIAEAIARFFGVDAEKFREMNQPPPAETSQSDSTNSGQSADTISG